MDIGKEGSPFVIEPVEEPLPRRRPAPPEPEREPLPERLPERVEDPELVPA